MPQGLLADLFRFLRRASAVHEGQGLTDSALLERFLTQHEEAAFELLMQRHGPMVLGVCQRIAGDAHAAEDAFQATFLVLARRAASIRKQASVGSWLHGVAQRIAGKVKAQAAARRDRERRAADMPSNDPLDELTWQELRSVLDEELGRLPEKYRAAVVLCYLEGKSYEQAAQELGWPKSSLASRLAKARALLREQLARRGLALSAGALGTALTEKASAAPVAALLTINIVKAAASVAAGKTLAAGCLSTKAIALTEEAMKWTIGIKMTLVMLLLALGLTVGAGYAGYSAWGEQTPPKEDGKPAPVAKEQPAKKDAASPTKDRHDDPLPAGAVARLGQDRWLHDSATFAAFLPDGKSVVTVSDAIRVFEFPSGKEIRRIAVGPADKDAGPAFGIAALTKDGKIMATTYSTIGTGEMEICLFDIATGKQLAGLKATGGIWALTFSPDGKHLATTAPNGTIRILDWAKAKEVRSFGGEDGEIVSRFDMTYAPDGKLLATARMGNSRDQEGSVVEVWDPATGTQIRTVPSEKRVCPAFSLDGKTLAYAMGKSVVLVEAANGKEIGKLTDERLEERLGKSGGIGAMVFGKDGTRLYATYTGGIVEWDVATRKLLRECATASGRLLMLSPDGKTLLRGGFGPEFFDVAGGKEITALNQVTVPVRGLQFTSDGSCLLTRGLDQDRFGPSRGRDSWHKWDALTGKDLGRVNFATSTRSVSVSPNAEVIARLEVREKSNDATPDQIVLTDAAGKELGKIPLEAPLGIVYMRFSPDGQTIAVARSWHGKMMLFDVPAAKLRHTLTIATRKYGQGTLLYSLDGKTVAFNADDGMLGLWDTTTGQRIGSLPIPKDVREKGDFRDQHEVRSTLGCFLPTAAVWFWTWSMAQRSCMSWPPLSRGALTRYPRKCQRPSQESRVAFSPDGKFLAHANGEVVHLWDIQTGQELAALKGHTGAVNAVAFSPDGKTVASASADSTALIWDVTKMQRPASPAKALQPGDLEKHWQALAGDDAAKAFDAICSLTAAPKDAVAWIKERVKPAAPLDRKRIEALITQLDDQELKVREKAASELLEIGDQIVPALDKALAQKPPSEARKRLEDLRAKTTSLILQGERLRAHRAVEVLEGIGTPQARQVLQALADGASEALVTKSAQAALKR